MPNFIISVCNLGNYYKAEVTCVEGVCNAKNPYIDDSCHYICASPTCDHVNVCMYVCIVYFHLVHITIKGLRIDVLRNIVNKVSILNRYWENSDEGLLPEP